MIGMAGTLLMIMWPISTTATVLRILKNGPDRALALPMPFMLLPILHADLNPGLPFYTWLASKAALTLLLFSCYQQKRKLARWATIACCAAALYTQLSATWLARS